MKKILPYTEPLFSTFHCSAICEIAGNESKQINNWMRNHYLRWRCITNFTEPFDHIITIEDSMFWNVPIFKTKRFEKEEISNCVHEKIVKLINKDYYVFLAGIDDYYITGKSNNLSRHLSHDGIILGYDNVDNTYQMAAYTVNQHFEHLCSELGIVSPALYLYENVVTQAEILRLLSIKFGITNNKSILEKIDGKILMLMNLEKDILSQFFDI